jgi:hypothetical protein
MSNRKQCWRVGDAWCQACQDARWSRDEIAPSSPCSFILCLRSKKAYPTRIGADKNATQAHVSSASNSRVSAWASCHPCCGLRIVAVLLCILVLGLALAVASRRDFDLMSAMSHHSRHDLHHHGLLLEEETSPPNYGSRSSSGGMSPKTPTRPPKLVNPVWSKVYLQLLEHIESGQPSREYIVRLLSRRSVANRFTGH